MAKITETVLYYNPGRPETMKHVAMMKSVLVRMGIRIRNIGPDQVMETVGYLAGMEGFQPRDTDGSADKSLPEIPVEMMVLKQFSNRRLDELLMKAVLTEHNSAWTFYHLYEELKEEHEAMAAGNGQ